MDQIDPLPRTHRKKISREKAKLLRKTKEKINILRRQFQQESALEEKSLRRFLPEWEKSHAHHILKELRDEIDVWDEDSKQLLQRKDQKIEMLFNTLEDTYEMEIRSISTFCDQLDYASRCYQTLRQAALNIYDVRTFELVHDFLSQTKQHLQDEEDKLNARVENFKYTANIKHMSLICKNHEDFMNKKFGSVCSEVAHRDSLRDSTVRKMRALQDKLLNWIEILKGDTYDVERPIKYMRLMRRQRNEVRLMNSLGEVEQACRRQIMDLKGELLTIELNTNKLLFGLRQELGYFMGIKSTIKGFVDRNVSSTNKKLLVVAGESYEVIKALKEIVRKGERLLEMAAHCRKHETEREQIVPVKEKNPSLLDDNFEFGLTCDLAKLTDTSEIEIVKQMKYMKNFWYRCSTVRLHNIMLKEDKKKLVKENEEYRNIIRTMKGLKLERRF